MSEQARTVARKVWAIVDWLNDAEEAARKQPGSVGVPLSLIGEATDKLEAIWEAAAWDAFSAGRRARGGVNLPWKFEPRDPITCAESLDKEAFAAWRAHAVSRQEQPSKLTSHGYAGICYCRKNPCICLPPPADRRNWGPLTDAELIAFEERQRKTADARASTQDDREEEKP